MRTAVRHSLSPHVAAFVLVSAIACAYYLWAVRATGQSFRWGEASNGYYNMLGRSFARGQLHLPIDPPPELLALNDPWDPQTNGQYRLDDVALFNKRYYLYHGAAPAILLFAPWRLLTGRDLPENFALFLLCFAAYVFWAGSLMGLLNRARAHVSVPLFVAMLSGVAFCQGIPFLLNRVWVYEIAIAAGALAVGAGTWSLIQASDARHSRWWLAASGVCFGLSIACRPHLALTAAVAAGAIFAGAADDQRFLTRLRTRQLLSFIVPLCAIGALIAWYNYGRFGNAFEFGVRYLLAGERNQQQLNLSAANILPGLYYMLWCPPQYSPVFPWIRQAFRYPFDSGAYGFPAGYFIEPTTGALLISPIVVLALLMVGARRRDIPQPVFLVIGALLLSAVVVVLFISATGFTTQRYEVDFLPTLVVAALAICGIRMARSSGAMRNGITLLLLVLSAYSVTANVALGITGPYDDMLRNRPDAYVRMARWFSPAASVSPALNPDIAVDLTVSFLPQPDGAHEPLVTVGRQVFGYFLFVEHMSGKVRIVSQSASGRVTADLGPVPTSPINIQFRYSGVSKRVSATSDGRVLIDHEIGTLVTAPAQVTPGENRVDHNVAWAKFTGNMQVLRKDVRPAS